MPLYRTYGNDSLKVGVWKVDESIGQLRSMLHSFSLYEAGYAKFKADNRKQEWLAVRVLLKALCGGEEKEIVYTESGKPLLKDGSAHVSFSHTKGYVAVAMHPTAEVGVDIEQYGTRVQKVASRFVREDELPSVQAGDEVYALLIHWSAKETMYKLMEEEAVDFLEHLCIRPFVPAASGTLLAYETRTLANRQFRICYDTHPDYVLTYSCIEIP